MTSQKTFFGFSVFWIPCIGGAWWKTSTAQFGWESVHEPGQFTLISMGLIRYSCNAAISRATMNHFMSIWCVRVFHYVLLKYCHENAEMQKRKFDDVTLRYSILLGPGPARVLVCGPFNSSATSSCGKGSLLLPESWDLQKRTTHYLKSYDG